MLLVFPASHQWGVLLSPVDFEHLMEHSANSHFPFRKQKPVQVPAGFQHLSPRLQYLLEKPLLIAKEHRMHASFSYTLPYCVTDDSASSGKSFTCLIENIEVESDSACTSRGSKSKSGCLMASTALRRLVGSYCSMLYANSSPNSKVFIIEINTHNCTLRQGAAKQA